MIWTRWRRQSPPDRASTPAEGPAEDPHDPIENAPVVALLLDRAGRVSAANAAAREFFAIDVSRLPLALVEVTRESRLTDVINSATVEAETRLVHRQRVVRSRLVPGPEPGETVMFLTDVTELRRLETVRQEFVANLSHELKTPLTSLRLAAESLLGDPPAESRRRFAERAIRETDYLTAIVDNLRELADIEGGRVQLSRDDVALADLIAETAGRLALDREVRTEVPANLRIMTDGSKLTQALGNLLDNAARFSPPGTAIEVTAAATADGVEIRVRDHGRGLSPEHWDRVFERFYKVDPARSREAGGSGLGLAIAKHLVLSLGGRIWTEPAGDGGQVFAIGLPSTKS